MKVENGTAIRVTDRAHPRFDRVGVVVLPCKDGRYIVEIDNSTGRAGTAEVLREEQFEVVR